MARASIVTKLPLDTWFRLMGIHPLHANQVRIDGQNPHCSDIYFQHEWQNSDHVSREEIAQAIAEAEQQIEEWLGYHLAPTWEVDEWRPTNRPFRPELVNLNGGDVRGYKQTVRADWGYFITGGIESRTLVEADADIVYTDVDSDGYFETATVTVNTVATDRNEIKIFYPGKDGDASWEIRPTEVDIDLGVATITFRRELAVNPDLLEVYDTENAEAIGQDNDDFLETVDVYRCYNDPQSQVSFLWEPLNSGDCATCNGSGCTNCAYATQTGCLILRGEPRQSLVGLSPGSWDNDNQNFTSEAWNVGRLPDIARLYYYSGWRDKSSRYPTRLAEEWQRIVAYMAASRLERPPCECSADTWRYWRTDFLLARGDEDGPAYYQPFVNRTAQSNPLDQPFGSRRGELYAWRKVAILGLIRAQAVIL